mgnify:CR=1 FL=1
MNLKETLAELADTSKVDPEVLEYEALKPCRIRQEEFIKDLRYTFRNNRVKTLIEFTKDSKKWEEFTSFEINDICRDFELNFKREKGDKEPSDKRIEHMVYNTKMSPHYDPFRAFFGENLWDGTPRLDKLARTVTVKEFQLTAGGKSFSTGEIWPRMFTRWMVAAVHCAMGHGPNGVMLLLIGPAQGTYKTTWLNHLCPPLLSEYAHTGHIKPSLTENVTINALAEKFILNIDDQLDTIFAKDFNDLKSIITTPFVTNRKAFRRDDQKRTRRANFVGSVNNTEIFRDHQNRRYLSFEVDGMINIEAARQLDMNQVWAEAYHLYKAGAQHYFDKQDEAIINSLADHFSFVTVEEEWFSRLFIPSEKADPLAIPYFPTEVLSIIKKASQLNVFERNLSTALKKMGISKIKMRLKGYKDPRDVYMLRENFTRNGDKIDVIGFPRDSEDWQAPEPAKFQQTEMSFKK